MRIDDILYFAPKVRFGEVDINGPNLPHQFRDRVDGFYIKPAKQCAKADCPFAAGVLLVTCIDALARLRFTETDDRESGKRFMTFAREELRSFSTDDLSQSFYREFRNGLVHQAMLKKGAQFSLNTSRTLTHLDRILIVNPRYLAEEVSSALDSYVNLLSNDDAERQRLADKLKQDLAEDFGEPRVSRNSGPVRVRGRAQGQLSKRA